MIKLKEVLSLLISIFLILSNLAFAQYDDPSSYEGRPIDPSREGIDYHREGDVIVYPARASPSEEDMRRFGRGEFSEEEMKRMAKEKFGDKFNEMEFKKSMMEFKERRDRKETFSYEHEGYGRYDQGPSYEGYSKEHMVFGMVFEHIGDDIDPREIKQQCNEPEKIADFVLSKLKEKVGDLQSICKRLEEDESKCEEHSKKFCFQIGTPRIREGATEMEKLNAIAYSCPANKDAIIEACKKRSRLHMEQRLENLDEKCEKRFDFEGDRLMKECERFRENQNCDKEGFMKRCMGSAREDFEKPTNTDRRKAGFTEARWECYDGSSNSHSDSSCRSEESWRDMARKSCESKCSKETEKCGVNSFSVSGECRPEEKLCSRDTKQCPDGSFVSRTGPNCEFAHCRDGFRCPEYKMPTCEAGQALQKKVDEKGCTYYYCEGHKCPDVAKPSCAADEAVQANYDSEHCVTSYQCVKQQTACPESQAPSCQAGTHLEKNIDERGCVSYYCKQDECSQVTKPACASGERLEAYYDSRGCTTSYQCIKYETACPAVTKPSCAENQHLTTRYDDKGCVTGYECVTVTSSDSAITGHATFTNENVKMRCENSWAEQKSICAKTPQSCDKASFIERCKEQERKHGSDLKFDIEKNCQTLTASEIKSAEDRCSRLEDEKRKCSEQSAKRCEHMKGNAEKCRELMTEENLRKFIIEEAKKRCKFTDIIEYEEDVKRADKAEIVLAVLNTAAESDIEKLKLFVDDLKEDLKLQETTIYRGTISPNSFGDIKLLPFVVNAKISARASSERAKEVKAKIVARTKVEEAASKLASLRDSDVPKEYLYIIEDKASEVLDASDKLEDLEKKDEQKGFGYKIKLFLGLARAAEQEEIKQLEDSKAKLQNSIETLAKLTDEVPSDVAKAILKEQVENLKQQQGEIQVLIETKGKKAKGLFGVFG